MYQKFSLVHSSLDTMEIVRLSGYFADEGSDELKRHIDGCLEQGRVNLVIDFSGIELISSPGVAALLDIASIVNDDFDGKIAVFGLDPHHLAVLEMAGFFFLATQRSDENSAIEHIREAE